MIDSRSSREGSTIRRRRECLGCAHRFTTYEEIEQKALVVVKRDGRREPFSKEKLLGGVTRACEKRPVSQEQLLEAADRVAEQISDEYDSEVPFLVIGEKVMEQLRDLDPVAYIRYASVYRRFDEATDFVQVVKKLEVKNDTATIRLPGF